MQNQYATPEKKRYKGVSLRILQICEKMANISTSLFDQNIYPNFY